MTHPAAPRYGAAVAVSPTHSSPDGATFPPRREGFGRTGKTRPTGEKLSPGGKTWFVAHAEGASIVTWEFLSPEGTAYSLTETMSLHPGLLLDAGQVDTVALENVPLSLNGWSHGNRKRCTFLCRAHVIW